MSESDARFVDRGASDRAFATVTAIAELLSALRRRARARARAGRARAARRTAARRGERHRRSTTLAPPARHRAAGRPRRRRDGASGSRPTRRATWVRERRASTAGAPRRVAGSTALPDDAARPAAPARARRLGRGPARLRRLALPGGRALDATTRLDRLRRRRRAARHHRRLDPEHARRPRCSPTSSTPRPPRWPRPVPARGRQGLPAARPLDRRRPARSAPTLDARLRAHRRRRGPRPRLDAIASPRRSVNRALAAGETADDDPRVPRRDLAHRHPAAARVPASARRPPGSALRCASRDRRRGRMRRRAQLRPLRRRAARAHQLAVDQSLASLGAAAAGPAPAAVSRFTPDVVFWALVRRAVPGRRRGRRAARSSGCAGTGSRRRRRRRRRPTRSPRCSTACSRSRRRGRDRAGLARPPARGSRSRAKETAHRHRAHAGRRRPPTTCSSRRASPNGRLRARDRTADIERTLPLSAIVDRSRPRPEPGSTAQHRSDRRRLERLCQTAP